MKLDLLPFVNAMQALKLPVQTRQRVAAIAIGYACACQSPLPSSEVANAEDHFRTNHQPAVRQLVSHFNEGVVIDVNLAQEFARNFWLLRYEAVFRCPRMDQIEGEFFASIFGTAKFFPPETRAFCNEHAVCISAIYQVACARISDLVTSLSADRSAG